MITITHLINIANHVINLLHENTDQGKWWITFVNFGQNIYTVESLYAVNYLKNKGAHTSSNNIIFLYTLTCHSWRDKSQNCSNTFSVAFIALLQIFLKFSSQATYVFLSSRFNRQRESNDDCEYHRGI